MPRRAAVAWSIGRQRRSGMPISALSAPSRPSLAVNDRLRGYVQERLAGRVERPDGVAVAGPQVAWIGRASRSPPGPALGAVVEPVQVIQSVAPGLPRCDSMRISPEANVPVAVCPRQRRARRKLSACLRTGRALRVPRSRACGRGKRFVTDEVMISHHPAEAADRAVPGHWEGN